jgi:multiple sugar transport system permease protein
MTARLRRIGDFWLDRQFLRIAALPAFVVVFAITAAPISLGLALSLTGYTQLNPTFHFVGLQNFTDILGDDVVHQVLWTTVIYVVGSVGVELVVGIGLALLLARQFRGVGGFRAAYLLPLMVGSAAVGVTWKALFHTSAGWINYGLSLLHLPQPDWLGDPTTSMPAVIIADMWIGVPLVATLCLAGILALPRAPLEAARVDGASPWQSFRYLILPGLRPILALVLLFRMVDAFRQFGLFQIMTGGGPGRQTTVLNFYLWQQTFSFGNLGYGAALAVLLIALMAVPVALVYLLGRR